MSWVVVQVTGLIRWIDCRIYRRINRQISRIFYNIREIVQRVQKIVSDLGDELVGRSGNATAPPFLKPYFAET